MFTTDKSVWHGRSWPALADPKRPCRDRRDRDDDARVRGGTTVPLRTPRAARLRRLVGSGPDRRIGDASAARDGPPRSGPGAALALELRLGVRDLARGAASEDCRALGERHL